jgi:hypothetical protein
MATALRIPDGFSLTNQDDAAQFRHPDSGAF